MNRMRILFLPLATAVTVWACSSTQDDWNKANAANTAAYQDYLQNQHTGSHVKEAQEAVIAVQRAADWPGRAAG